MSYELLATADRGRRGVFRTAHGSVDTPAFMPCGTLGTVKALTPQDVSNAGTQMVLANAYHLWVRVGEERLERLGGLHKFMGWSGPILTDSGGYQVFSLRDVNKVTEEGVRFRAPHDGQYRMLTPEVSVGIQTRIGVDVAMAFDECIEWPADRARVAKSTERTTRWLERCLEVPRDSSKTMLFGIVQGGLYQDLRVAHAQQVAEYPVAGVAIGGLSVGEPRNEMLAMVEATTPHLPADRVRYLMGVGYPLDIVEAAMRGVDLFDCVLPTRSGRFGQMFTSQGRLTIKHARHRDDKRPPDPHCACYTCQSFSRAYLRHLFVSNEMLAPRLLTLHNLTFYQALMARLREAIEAGPDAVAVIRDAAEQWMEPVDD